MSQLGQRPHRPALRRAGLVLLGALAAVQLLVWLGPAPPGHGAYFRRVSTVQDPEVRAPIAAEVGPFRDLVAGQPGVALGTPSPHVVVPTREERRALRAFEGAPPFIPHPIDAELERTQDCVPCHGYGGYAPGLRTFAPRSPHPEMANCLQCHVRPVTAGVLVASDWTYAAWPDYGAGSPVQGAPPPIPHTLQMREHCPACHAGTAAAPDIRTTHPERTDCRQCHLSAEEAAPFVRPTPGGGGG